MDSIATMTIITEYKTCARKTVTQVKRFFGCPTSQVTEDTGNSDSELGNEPGSSNFQLSTIDIEFHVSLIRKIWQFRFITRIGATSNSKENMNPSNEQSKYLYEQYGNELSQQLKPNASQYVLTDLDGNSSKQKAQLVQKVDSEYLLRDLQNQSDENQNISRDAPNRPFLIGTPVNAKEIRAQLDSLDNAIVTPQIINGKVYFPTHTEADTRTAVEGSTSNRNLNESHSSGAPAPRGVDLHKVKFPFAQLVKLLESTCQRLEREFVKQNQLFEAESSQLGSSLHGDAESADVQTCLEIEEAPETGVNTARSFATPSGSTQSVLTAREIETIRSSQDVRTAVEILSEMSRSSQDVTTALEIQDDDTQGVDLHKVKSTFAQLIKLLDQSTCQRLEREFVKQNQISEVELSQLRTAHESISLDSIRTAQSVEPNLLSTRTAAGRDRRRRPMEVDNCCVVYRKFDYSEVKHNNCTILVDEKGFTVQSKESNYEINHDFGEFEESWYGEKGRNEFVCKLMVYQPLSRKNVYSIWIETPTVQDKQMIASFVGCKNDTAKPEYMRHGHWKHRAAARWNQMMDAKDALLESQYKLFPEDKNSKKTREPVKSPLYSTSERSLETRTQTKRNKNYSEEEDKKLLKFIEMTPLTTYSSLKAYAEKVPHLGGPTRSSDSIRRRIESLDEKGKLPQNRQKEFDARKRNGKKN